MKVLLKLRATRKRPSVREELTFDDETALLLHIGNKYLRGLAVRVSITGAVIAGGRLGIAGFVVPLDDEARSFYRPPTVVKKAG